MVKHLVMWLLKEQANGMDKAGNARQIKARLEALQGRVPGLIRLEVGIDFSREEASGDLVLYSEFETRAALEAYQGHPEHRAILPFVREAVSERRLVDYETRESGEGDNG
jgi:hypothetical protein